MPDKYKNRKKDLPDFLRYSKGEMTGKERNTFERKLQQDSFAEEAMEGLASLSSLESTNDIADLQKQLNSRTKNRQKFMIYRIAASIAVLMIISSVFLIVERNKPANQLSEKTAMSQILEIAESEPVKVPDTREFTSESKANKVSEAGKSSKKTINASDNPPLPTEIVTFAVTNNVEKIPEKKINSSEVNVTADESAVPIAFRSNIKSEPPKGVKEMAKSDSQLSVRPDTTVPALNEVVVVGYSRSKARSGAGKYDSPSRHINPQPVGGKSAFEKYIQENLHHPDSIASGQDAVVELSFLVQTDGKIDSIKVVSSPGRLFSEEAIRLIKSVAPWKPAQENGKDIEEEVRIRIIFRN